jgi:hypothetical protein
MDFTKKIIIILFLFSNVVVTFARENCQSDYQGTPFCAPPGGMAVQTINGVFCALGKCIADNQGFVKCSDTVGGGATNDDQGNVYCVGNCVSPKKELCIQMRGEKK